VLGLIEKEPPLFDLVIRNGMLVVGDSVIRGSIGVSEGKIAELAPGEPGWVASEIYDANGRYVLPGLVDAHVHFRDPGNVHKEGAENGSRAAAIGGVTTALIMPTDNPPTSDLPTFREKISLGSRSYVDFALQAIVGHDLSSIPALADAGCCSFEIFFGDIPEAFYINTYQALLAALSAIKPTGRVAGVTPMMQSIVKPLTDEFVAAGRNKPIDFARSRPPEAESLGVRLACEAAIETGCPIHLRQISSRFSVDVLASFKQRAPRLISAEVLPQNLLLTERRLIELGPFAKMSPPLRCDADLSATWEALESDLIDIIVTDHAPHLRSEKEAGLASIWDSPSGIPGLETLLPLLLNCCAEERISIERAVTLVTERPARIFGLYPRKGTLLPGADADMIVLDTSFAYNIAAANFATKARFTPFEGMPARGRIDLLLLRGRRVSEEGRLVAQPFGAFVPALSLPEQ
jgi:dihydroorotase